MEINTLKKLSNYIEFNPFLNGMNLEERKIFCQKFKELNERGYYSSRVLSTLAIYARLMSQLNQVFDLMQYSDLTETSVDSRGVEKSKVSPLFSVEMELIFEIHRTERIIEEIVSSSPDKSSKILDEGLEDSGVDLSSHSQED